jgi:ABC-type branched-subunit amino acid transport system ATPase component
LAIEVDVTSEEAVQEMVRRAVLGLGGLDILVCSAGIATSAPAAQTTLADWERSYAVLARGYFLPARETLRVLVDQGRGGSIVFVGSKNALVAGSNASAYSSAKAASLHLARCLAEEGGEHGIRVNTVNPDAVIEGSALWSSDWKAERANTYGVSEEELPRSIGRGRRSMSTCIRRTWPKPSRTSPGPAAPNRPETSSTSTAASSRLSAMSDRAAALVEMRGITKSYGGVRAVDGVDFAIHAGAVHALVGENGAGKSTLVKLLTGVVQPDEGVLLIDGQAQRIGDPQTAHRLGIVAMYQEPTVFQDLTAAENVFAGRHPRTILRTVDWRTMRRETERILEEFGVDIGPDTPVRGLGVADRQLLEITKALSSSARLLIMDEPTAALSPHEVDNLFETVRRLRERGSRSSSSVIGLRRPRRSPISSLFCGTAPHRNPPHIRAAAGEIASMVGRSLDALFPEGRGRDRSSSRRRGSGAEACSPTSRFNSTGARSWVSRASSARVGPRSHERCSGSTRSTPASS